MALETKAASTSTQYTNVYDVIVIGAGQAGVPLAYKLAKAKRAVALVERKLVGGSCINFGCTPTKAAISSARLVYDVSRAIELGIKIDKYHVDFDQVIKRARAIASAHRHGMEKSLEDSENPVFIHGHARIEGKHKDSFVIDVDGDQLLAKQIILDTGTRTLVPAVKGIDQVPYLSSENWLSLEELPRHLLVLGGGYIGLEMGQLFRRLGSKVTIIESSNQILVHEDLDVAECLYSMLAAEDIELRISSEVQQVATGNGGITAHVQGSAGAYQINGSHLFIASGRKPNTDDLGLESVAVRADEDGFIDVDSHLSTSVPGIWAAGDIRGGPMFTHTSWDDYRTIFSQIAGDASRVRSPIVPYAVFTDPELGRVGLTEKQAKDNKINFAVGKFPVADNSRAVEMGRKEGFIKLLVDKDTKLILGAAVLCAEAAELVQIYSALMSANAPYTVLIEAMQIHPTLSEAIQSAASAIE
jgi:pyruvate/2-oxoglutarate dehydrogenase complex dihydrolipoamide dehydrogenase (E3) component